MHFPVFHFSIFISAPRTLTQSVMMAVLMALCMFVILHRALADVPRNIWGEWKVLGGEAVNASVQIDAFGMRN